jgi:hypothetical protein
MMRAANDDTTKPQSPTMADELARDLPGLPLETKHLRADELGVLVKKGIFRREQLVPWSEIVGHRWRPFGLTFERQGYDECEVHLVRAWASRATRRVIDAAWREYVLRKIERDNALCGTHTPARVGAGGSLAIILGTPFAVILVFRLLYAVPDGFLAEAILACSVFLVISASLLLAGFRERGLMRETLMNWYRWELSREGIAHWSGVERTLLAPSPGDAIGSGWARVGGVVVPLGHLTFSRMASPIVLAMLERNRARRPLLGWLGLREAMLFFMPWFGAIILTGIAFEIVHYYSYWWPPDWIGVLFTVAFWAMLAMVWVESKLRSRHSIAAGRAMLERLGW